MGKLSASVVACWMVFTTGLAPASVAEPREHRSFIGGSSLFIQVKSEHKCKWTRVCDYFAPAESCSHPPCCKKSHHEKVCQNTTSDKSTPQNCPDGMVGTPPDCRCTSASKGACEYIPH